jgi:hypothetical protein
MEGTMIYFIRATIVAFFAYLAFSFIAADWWWFLGQEKGDIEARLFYVFIVLAIPYLSL